MVKPNELRDSFSPFVCACFTLNYIVGTGFLALPWAFYQGGWLLSGMAMVVVCVAANVGSDYILSAMARAECILANSSQSPSGTPANGTSSSNTQNTGEIGLTDMTPVPASTEGHAHEQTFLLGDGCPDASNTEDLTSINLRDKLLVGTRCIDVPEMCRLFLGDLGFKGYGLCVSLYLYGALWSFTSVFGNAVALAVPTCSDPYALSVLIFAIIVVPMSFLELSEQKFIQIILSAGRILMILLMIITPLAAAIFCPGKSQLSCIPHFAQQSSPNGVPNFQFSGVHRMMPIMVYAAIFHFSIPSLAQEVALKSQLGNVFGLTFLLCGSLYACIGIIDAWYFGGAVQQSVNLNWAGYHGGTGTIVSDTDGQSEWINVAWWANILSFFVLMFPAINVISAFPLHAFSLGKSLMGIYYGDEVRTAEENRRITSIFRAISSIPPLIGGLFVRDLGTITDYTGLSGLAIAFCFPALLYISSEKKSKQIGISHATYYERLGSSTFAAMVVLMFGVVSIIGVFMSLVLKG